MGSREWYWWTCLQGRNGDADVEMDLWTPRGRERVGHIEKVALACTLSRVTQVRAGKLVAQGAPARAMGWPRGWGGGEEAQEGVPGASMGVPTPWQGDVGEIWWARQARTQGVPLWACLSVYPKTWACLFYCFMTFTNSSDINRGYPQPPFSVRRST